MVVNGWRKQIRKYEMFNTCWLYLVRLIDSVAIFRLKGKEDISEGQATQFCARKSTFHQREWKWIHMWADNLPTAATILRVHKLHMQERDGLWLEADWQLYIFNKHVEERCDVNSDTQPKCVTYVTSCWAHVPRAMKGLLICLIHKLAEGFYFPPCLQTLCTLCKYFTCHFSL